METGTPASDRKMQLMLEVDPGSQTDAQELDDLTSQLRRVLLDLDVESVDRVRQGTVPPGARAVDVLALGTLIVTLAKSTRVLSTLVNTVQSWLSGAGQRSVKLEINGDILEVTGLTSSDQRRLIASWLERHSSK